MGILSWASIAGAVAKAVSAVLGWLRDRNLQRQGAQAQKEKQQKVADEATERMTKAAAGPRGEDVTQKELDRGTF